VQSGLPGLGAEDELGEHGTESVGQALGCDDLVERRQLVDLDAIERDDQPPLVTDDGLPKHRPMTESDGTPNPRAQRNFTDPESRIMESNGTFIQGYNAQIVVDEAHQVIVAESVTKKPPDSHNLAPMLERVVDNCGQAPKNLTADAGYWSQLAPETCEQLGTEAYIATERHRHWETTKADGPQPLSPDPDPRERMRHKVRSPEGRTLYSRRKVIVEPVFGQIKQARGFRRFLRRGLVAVNAEWSLVCSTHNLLKLFRAGGLAASPAT